LKDTKEELKDTEDIIKLMKGKLNYLDFKPKPKTSTIEVPKDIAQVSSQEV
jgi:hypothetical protein